MPKKKELLIILILAVLVLAGTILFLGGFYFGTKRRGQQVPQKENVCLRKTDGIDCTAGTDPLQSGYCYQQKCRLVDNIPGFITLEGRVYMTGNEPFTQLAIIDDEDNVYELVGKKIDELSRIQGSRVHLDGRIIGQGLYAQQIEVFHYGKITENEEGEFLPPAKQKGIRVMTNKKDYKRGESVKIGVVNNSDIPIWYAKNASCGLLFWLLENCEGEEILYRQTCFWATFQHDFTRFNPGEALEDRWNGMIWKLEKNEFELAESGCHRIVFPYSLKEKKPMGEGWYPDKIEVYSDEFMIR